MARPSWTNYLWRRGNAWMGLAHKITWTVEGRTPAERTTDRAFFPAWGLIGLLFATLAVLSWLGASTAAWIYYTRGRGYSEVTWTDLAFPWQWPERREKQGRALLARVDDLFADRKYREAMFHLQTGLRLAPSDLKARRQWAAIQRNLGRIDAATTILAEGLPYASQDAAFVELTFTAQLEAQEFDRIEALAAEWLRRPGRDTSADTVVRTVLAEALGYLGRPEEAIRVLEDGGLSDQPVGHLVRAEIEWVNGRPAAAIERLRAAVLEHPRDDRLRLRLVHYADRSGRPGLVEDTLLGRIRADPDNPAKVRDLLGWYAREGANESLERELVLHLPRIAPFEIERVETARLLARYARVEEIDRVVSLQPLSDPAASTLALARIDALILARRLAEAEAEAAAWEQRWLTAYPVRAVDLQVIRALVRFAAGDLGGGEKELAAFIDSPQLGPRGLLAVSRRFAAVGLRAPTLRVLRRALEAAPTELQILREAALLAADLEEWSLLADALQRLLARRHTDPALLDELAGRLESDRTSFLPGRRELLERINANRQRSRGTSPAG